VKLQAQKSKAVAAAGGGGDEDGATFQKRVSHAVVGLLQKGAKEIRHGSSGSGLVACSECRRELAATEEVQHCAKKFSKEQFVLWGGDDNAKLWAAHKGGYTLCVDCAHARRVGGVACCRFLRVAGADVEGCNGRYDYEPLDGTFRNLHGAAVAFRAIGGEGTGEGGEGGTGNTAHSAAGWKLFARAVEGRGAAVVYEHRQSTDGSSPPEGRWDSVDPADRADGKAATVSIATSYQKTVQKNSDTMRDESSVDRMHTHERLKGGLDGTPDVDRLIAALGLSLNEFGEVEQIHFDEWAFRNQIVGGDILRGVSFGRSHLTWPELCQIRPARGEVHVADIGMIWQQRPVVLTFERQDSRQVCRFSSWLAHHFAGNDAQGQSLSFAWACPTTGKAELKLLQNGRALAHPERAGATVARESYLLRLWTEAYAHYIVAIGTQVEPAFNHQMLQLVGRLHATDAARFAGVAFKKAPLKRLERVVEKTKEDWPAFLHPGHTALGDAAAAAAHLPPAGVTRSTWNETLQHRYLLGGPERHWEDYGNVLDIVRGSVSCATEDQIVGVMESIAEAFVVVRVKNTMHADAKTVGEYRDIKMLVVVSSSDPVYNSVASESGGVNMICEIQLLLNSYLEVKKSMHPLYKIVREPAVQ
jgi:hypothetical protein